MEELGDCLKGIAMEVLALAEREGQELLLPDAFTEWMLGVLSEAGYISQGHVAPYIARGMRASGYSLDDDGSTLFVFLSDYSGSERTLPQSEVDTAFRRMSAFAAAAAAGLHRRLEESSEAWDMAQQIEAAWPDLTDLRLVLLTSAVVKGQPHLTKDINGLKVRGEIWDLERTAKVLASDTSQEPIRVVLADFGAPPLPAIGPFRDAEGLQVYVTAIPGQLLSDIYATHGPRLLELNVRSFLQARGKVNSGMQTTLRTEPGRFLAYNNGVTMTARGVETMSMPGGVAAISAFDDLQIVNGGQTTASLYHASVKNKADLTQVHVQAKISVVEQGDDRPLIARISEFANSQNRVNIADFSSNHPFHVGVEQLSRRMWAPGEGGSHHMTRWFYERARGQYADELARARTPAAQRAFKIKNPLSQKLTKTDLAKYENSWDQLPFKVALGAEKNFRDFMIRLAERGAFTPDEAYFRRLVCKAIIFAEADKVHRELALGGHKASAVPYVVALLANRTAQRIDLEAIWRDQAVSPALRLAIEEVTPLVHRTMIEGAGSGNVGEHAKKTKLWDDVRSMDWAIPPALARELLSGGHGTSVTSPLSVGEVLTEGERVAMAAVTGVSGETWFALSSWAKQTNNLKPWERGLAFSLGRLATEGGHPSRKQAIHGARILQESTALGFTP